MIIVGNKLVPTVDDINNRMCYGYNSDFRIRLEYWSGEQEDDFLPKHFQHQIRIGVENVSPGSETDSNGNYEEILIRNHADPILDKDVVNLRTLKRYLSSYTGEFPGFDESGESSGERPSSGESGEIESGESGERPSSGESGEIESGESGEHPSSGEIGSGEDESLSSDGKRKKPKFGNKLKVINDGYGSGGSGGGGSYHPGTGNSGGGEGGYDSPSRSEMTKKIKLIDGKKQIYGIETSYATGEDIDVVKRSVFFKMDSDLRSDIIASNDGDDSYWNNKKFIDIISLNKQNTYIDSATTSILTISKDIEISNSGESGEGDGFYVDEWKVSNDSSNNLTIHQDTNSSAYISSEFEIIDAQRILETSGECYLILKNKYQHGKYKLFNLFNHDSIEINDDYSEPNFVIDILDKNVTTDVDDRNFIMWIGGGGQHMTVCAKQYNDTKSILLAYSFNCIKCFRLDGPLNYNELDNEQSKFIMVSDDGDVKMMTASFNEHHHQEIRSFNLFNYTNYVKKSNCKKIQVEYNGYNFLAVLFKDQFFESVYFDRDMIEIGSGVVNSGEYEFRQSGGFYFFHRPSESYVSEDGQTKNRLKNVNYYNIGLDSINGIGSILVNDKIIFYGSDQLTPYIKRFYYQDDIENVYEDIIENPYIATTALYSSSREIQQESDVIPRQKISNNFVFDNNGFIIGQIKAGQGIGKLTIYVKDSNGNMLWKTQVESTTYNNIDSQWIYMPVVLGCYIQILEDGITYYDLYYCRS